MAGTTLDTNILLDVLLDDPVHAASSARAIDEAAREGALLVGPATMAELVTVFARRRGPTHAEAETRRFLRAAGIAVSPWHEDAAATAGLAYAAHLATRDPALVACGAGGERSSYKCPHCGNQVAWRSHILTDFLIGAQARHATGRILTRDQNLHGKVNGLKVVVPK